MCDAIVALEQQSVLFDVFISDLGFDRFQFDLKGMRSSQYTN